MVFISKKDKKSWQDYIDNFEHFTLNLKKDDLKNQSLNRIFQNIEFDIGDNIFN